MARILVADDDPGTLTLVGQILRMAGHEVTSTNRGADAICLLREHPDLLILDVNMPGMNGHEVVQELGPTRPKVILMSAAEMEPIEEEKPKIDRYLKKPFSMFELLSVVAQCLGKPHPKFINGYKEDEV